MPDSSGATVLDDHDLPESIIVWEILVRLSPKDLLCCRAVRKSWRRDTSARDFLLEHHSHQPFLPIIEQSPPLHDSRLVVFHNAGTGNQKLWPFLPYATPHSSIRMTDPHLHASRDGLIVFSTTIGFPYSRQRVFYVCNPATRHCAPLPHLHEHGPQAFTNNLAGLYLHQPSGEYRVLYFRWNSLDAADFYIMTVGSDEPRRFIGPSPAPRPSVEHALFKGLSFGPCHDEIAPVLHRGGLHWDLGRYHQYFTVIRDIMVFHTSAETFRLLRRPAQAPLGLLTSLLEMEGALALFSVHVGVAMDVFVMQDYEDEVWALRYRIELSAVMTELPQLGFLIMVVVNERELLIQLHGRVLHCDIDGKVLGVVEGHGDKDASYRKQITTHSLRESIVPHAFFETQQATRNRFE